MKSLLTDIWLLLLAAMFYASMVIFLALSLFTAFMVVALVIKTVLCILGDTSCTFAFAFV